MALFCQQLINGLALGSTYALMAIGFTLIFGVLRLLNMAHGELYTLGAYLAYTGIVMLGLSPWLVLPLAIVGVFVFALAVERVAFRPLRDAPHFIPLVSTIAVSTILLELIRLVFGPTLYGVDSFIPLKHLDFGLFRVDLLQLFMMATALVLVAVLQFFLSMTQWGKAIRAVAQDLVVGQLLGINVNRVIGLTFAIGSALGAVAGILISMYVGGIYPSMGFVALVKAFTAAILGGMGSVPGAVLGAFVLGVSESLSAAFLPSGFSDAVPYILLFAVLVFMPAGLTGRGRSLDVTESHGQGQPSEGLVAMMFKWTVFRANPFVLGSLFAILVLATAPFLGDYLLRIMTIIAIFALIALGMNLVLGLSGQLSLCHFAFVAVGAYSTAVLSTKLSLGFWAGMAGGMGLAAALAAIVAAFALRVRGYYLALVTLAFGEIIHIVISYWVPVTGGMMGIRRIPPVTLAGFPIVTTLGMFYVCALFLMLSVLVYQFLILSAFGRALIAVRDDEAAARSSGVDARLLKIAAFVGSAVFAAVGGSLYAHLFSAISPDVAALNGTIEILVITVLGGLGSAAGAVFGAALVNVLPEIFRQAGDYRLLIYGIVLFIMILYQPQGLFSIKRRLARGR
jgi:branched-chain amino acid transport system permease protein